MHKPCNWRSKRPLKQLQDFHRQLEIEKLYFFVQAEHLSDAPKTLNEAHRREGATCEEMGHWAKVVEEQATLVEERLLHQAFEEFKESVDFSITAERRLSDKIQNLFWGFIGPNPRSRRLVSTRTLGVHVSLSSVEQETVQEGSHESWSSKGSKWGDPNMPHLKNAMP